MTGVAHSAAWAAAQDASILIVSPHFDDAVLSAWAVMDLDGGGRVDVLTVFGGEPDPPLSTEADRTCGFIDSAHAMRARRAEDSAALDGVARRAWHLPLAEQQYAGGQSRDAASAALRSALDSWISDQRVAGLPNIVLAIPAGAGVQVDAGLAAPSVGGSLGRGGLWLAWLRTLKHRWYLRRKRGAQQTGALAHPDHIFVRDRALECASAYDDVAVLVYEDLPYCWSGGPERFVHQVERAEDWSVTPLTVPVSRARKSAALAHYASQLAALDPVGRRLESAETLPEVERYWQLTRRESAAQ